MKRTWKTVGWAALAGAALGVAGGAAFYQIYAPPKRSLEQSLWIIDPEGRFHSPTSEYTRAELERLSRAGAHVRAKEWGGEVFLNQSADPDVVAKTFRMGPPVDGARLDPGPRAEE